MELQGNKATHDFLSLYTKDSSFQHQDPRPPSQGFFLKTHDFLQPLERAEKADKSGRDVAVRGPADQPATGEHVLPGGIGTFSICHVGTTGPRPPVKPELVTCAAIGRPEPSNGGGYTLYPAAAAAASAPFSLWGDSAAKDPASRGHWSLPFAGRGSGATASSASRHNPGTERKIYMDAVSRSSRGFDDEDNDGDEFNRREASSSLKELTVRTDGKGSGSGSDQRPNTPRSKHSATEQRRRSKINDRFQILREIIPHSDQKRDKASFLLEVIEYIRFLQEKVEKHESSVPEWNQDNAKLMPWANVYFRSFWKNAENKSVSGDGISDPAQPIKNGSLSPPAFTIPANAAAAVSVAQNPTTESSPLPSFPYKSTDTLKSLSSGENATCQAQAQWARPALNEECGVSGEMLNGQDELAIDEGTISLSTQYSQEVLTALNQALQNTGIDLSQASINVQINLGKRATTINKRSCNHQKQKDPSSTNQAVKRRKAEHTS